MNLDICTNILIDRPPKAVWSVLIDFAAYDDWNPIQRRVVGKPELGAFLRLYLSTPEQPERSSMLPARIQVLRPESILQWGGGVPGLFRIEHYFILEQTENRSTRFTHGERFLGPVFRPFHHRMRTKLTPRYEAANRALKARAERLAEVAE